MKRDYECDTQTLKARHKLITCVLSPLAFFKTDSMEGVAYLFDSGEPQKKVRTIQYDLVEMSREKIPRLGLTIVCISDTHGKHRKLTETLKDLPDADLLVHAGDFCDKYNESHAIDFNNWLGDITWNNSSRRPKYKHIIVAQGNHDRPMRSNSPSLTGWKNSTSHILTNANFLLDQSFQLNIEKRTPTTLDERRRSENESCNAQQYKSSRNYLNIFCTSFLKPSDSMVNYDDLEANIDILISHHPPHNHPGLRRLIERIKPTVVISGHLHGKWGITQGEGVATTYVNAASGHKMRKGPIVLTL